MTGPEMGHGVSADGPHPDEGTIHAWLDGELSPDESARLEAHVASCPGCSATVAEARGLIALSSRILSALDNVPGGVIPTADAAPPTDVVPLRIMDSAAPASVRKRAWWRTTAGQLRVAAAALVLVSASLVWRTRGRDGQFAQMESPDMVAATSPVADSAALTPIPARPSAPAEVAIAAGARPAPAKDVRSKERALDVAMRADEAKTPPSAAPKSAIAPSAAPTDKALARAGAGGVAGGKAAAAPEPARQEQQPALAKQNLAQVDTTAVSLKNAEPTPSQLQAQVPNVQRDVEQRARNEQAAAQQRVATQNEAREREAAVAPPPSAPAPASVRRQVFGDAKARPAPARDTVLAERGRRDSIAARPRAQGVPDSLRRPTAITLSARVARATVRGIITETNTGRPLSSVTVYLPDENRSVQTGSDGRYEIANVAPGTHALSARALGFTPNTTTIRVTADRVYELDLTMRLDVSRLAGVVVTGNTIASERLSERAAEVAGCYELSALARADRVRFATVQLRLDSIAAPGDPRLSAIVTDSTGLQRDERWILAGNNTVEMTWAPRGGEGTRIRLRRQGDTFRSIVAERDGLPELIARRAGCAPGLGTRR